MRADTGVGPSMASGSHVWSGIWADLATAPRSSAAATQLASAEPFAQCCEAVLKTVAKFVVPRSRTMKKIATAMPTSPIAFITNAFFAAATGSWRSCQNPIRRYDESPTSPHPARSSTKFAAMTRSSIENRNRSR